MAERQHCRAFLLPLLALCVTGCEIREYNVSTRLDRDGTIHREIRQPLDDTLPPDALDEPLDNNAATQPSSRPALVELSPKWRNKWAILQLVSAPATATSESGSPEIPGLIPYFRAIGDFDSIDAVPESYYRAATPLVDRASEDGLSHSIDDYHLFAIEHWEETISETISLAEYITAADGFSRLVLPPFHKALDELYGHDYELKDLHTWFRRQFSEAFRQYCLWFYQYHPGDVDDLSNQSILDLKAVFALMDIDLPLTEKGDVDLDSWPDSLDQSAVQIVRRNVRFKDGQELSEEEAGGLWDMIQSDLGVQLSAGQDDSDEPDPVERTRLQTPPKRVKSGRQVITLAQVLRSRRGSGGTGLGNARIVDRGHRFRPARLESKRIRRVAEDSAPSTAPAAEGAPLAESWENQFTAMYGDDGQTQLLRIDVQLGGAHHNSPINRLRPLFGGAPILPGVSRFNYALETSGPIIETNGVRLADNRVRWKFNSEELFPDGISMTARAIRWNRDAERKLFGRIVLKDLETVIKLVDTISLDGTTLEALGDAVKEGSLSPIQDLLQDEDPEVREEAKKILQLKESK